MTKSPTHGDVDDPSDAEVPDENLDARTHAPPDALGSDKRPRSARRRLRGTCPIADQWREWDFLSLRRRELPAKAPHFNEHVDIGPEVGVIAVVWKRGEHNAPYRPPTRKEGRGADRRFSLGPPAHAHTEFEVDGHRVHLDRVSGTKYGPGRSWTEVVAFVDGACVGHGWMGACSLGFGGTKHLPLTVAIAPDVAIVVTADREVTLHRGRNAGPGEDARR